MFRCLLSRPRWPATARSISTPAKSLVQVPRGVVEVRICALCLCVCLRSLISFVYVSLAQRHDLVRSMTTRIEHSHTNDRTNSLLVTGEKRACSCVGSWQKQRARDRVADLLFCFVVLFASRERKSAFGCAAMCFRMFVVVWLVCSCVGERGSFGCTAMCFRMFVVVWLVCSCVGGRGS